MPRKLLVHYAAALERNDGPTLIALSRQAVPLLSAIPVAVRRAGVLKGGYVAVQESTSLTLILLATGSELHLAVAAAKELGSGVRVVSLPSFERFNRQAVEYRENVLPFACQRRIAIEAGVTALWHQYVGPNGKIIGIDRFGLSAPGPVVFKELGITVDAILSAARSL